MSKTFRSFKKDEEPQTDEMAVYTPEYPSLPDAPPDFGLADLTRFDPVVLKSANRAVDRFILGLSLAYNDLKSIEWTHYQIHKHRPSEPTVSPVAGQIQGMTVWSMRMSMALIHELLNLVQKADEEGWLKSAEFVAARDLLVPAARAVWDALVAVAIGTDDQGASVEAEQLRQYLELVRNNVSYHYDQPKALLRAYDAYFFERPKDVFNEAAYASLGRTLEATRYYFADAAAVHYYDSGEKRELFKKVTKLRRLVNGALLTVVHAYLESRQRALKAET